jgi:hypothetical protein
MIWYTGPAHPAWKGDAASDNVKRKRARRLYPLGPCERCGKPGRHRHHIDGNPGNNDPSNIKIVCPRCHMVIDGRLARFIAGAKRATAARQRACRLRRCRICGCETKKFCCHGRCHSCHSYYTYHGYERTVLLKARAHPTKPSPCSICGRRSKGLRLGRCTACYKYYKRHGHERTVLLEARARPTKLKACLICGRESKTLTLRRCRACYKYYIFHGYERTALLEARTRMVTP